MKATQTDVKNAILVIAKEFGLKNNYAVLIEINNNTLPHLVELIVYDMFLHCFQSISCSEELYGYYQLILSYGTELKENGYVTFN